MRILRVLLCLLMFAAPAAFAQQSVINIGTSANDNTGDPARTWASKDNVMFHQLYNQYGGASSLATTGVPTWADLMTLCTGTKDSTHACAGDGTMQLLGGGGGGASLTTANTWSAVQSFVNSDLALFGSSTGKTTFTSDNAGASNFTLHVPAVNDTLVALAATQTLTGKSIAASEVNSGTLAAAQMPAFTGDMTTSAGAVATTVSKINNGTVPSSAAVTATDSSGHFIALTVAGNLAVNGTTLTTTQPANPQSGTSYTVQTTDAGKAIPVANASSVAVTLPAATTSGFGSGFSLDTETTGLGTATWTPGSGTINGASSLPIPDGEGATINSDGTNYFTTACTACTPAISLSHGGHDGVIGILQAAQMPVFTGDVTDGSGGLAMTVKGINGTLMSSLTTGLVKNTTTTGAVSIATATDVLAPFTGTKDGTHCPAGDGTMASCGGGGGVSASSANSWTAVQTFTNSDLALLGSSTGGTIFTSDNASATNFTVHVPAANDTLVNLAGAQTLTNKSIASTEITGLGTFAAANAATPPAIGGTTPAAGSFTAVVGTTYNGVTIPSVTDTADLLGQAQTITGVKTFTNSDLKLLGSSTGGTVFTSDNAGATNFTMHVPGSNGTLVTLADTQTLTGKSIATTELTGALQAGQEPAHTGDMTNTAGSLATVVGKLNGGTVPTSAPLVATNSSGQPTAVTVGPGLAITSGVLSPSATGNAQTGTTYTFLSTDGGKTVPRTNASTMSDTLPAASTFGAGFGVTVQNNGSGTDTITSTSTISGGTTTTTIVLAAGQGCDINTFDGSTYQVSACTAGISGGGGSGTVTHTGGSLTANAVVLGAGTADTKVVAGITSDGTSALNLGVAGTSVGKVVLANVTSGTITLQAPTGALGSVTVSVPAATDTLVGRATTDTLTNKSIATTELTGALQAAQEPAHTGDMTNTAGSLATVVGKINGGVMPVSAPCVASNSSSQPIACTTVTYLIDAGTKFTAAGTGACATITTTVGGTSVGKFTCTGTTGASTVTITLPTSTNGWRCQGDDMTTANVWRQTSATATTCVLTATTITANDVSTFLAMGY